MRQDGQPQAPAQLADTNFQLVADGTAHEAEAAGQDTGYKHQQQQPLLQLMLQPPSSQQMPCSVNGSVNGWHATWLPGQCACEPAHPPDCLMRGDGTQRCKSLQMQYVTTCRSRTGAASARLPTPACLPVVRCANRRSGAAAEQPGRCCTTAEAAQRNPTAS